MPPKRCTAARKSHTAGPALTGGRSGKPVAFMIPLMAWIVRSMAGRSR